MRVYLGNSQVEFSVTSTDSSYVLSFNYSHSTHEIGIDLVSTCIGGIAGPSGQPDGKCDVRDIGLVSSDFGETVSPAPANCDLTGSARAKKSLSLSNYYYRKSSNLSS